ncbi:MAG: hypothetical protein RHS_1293 [Robinsoniella sp. RHS]|nr:MAG: hypothetical protein RHS_1293 [Robinsoniella sp. RHS]
MPGTIGKIYLHNYTEVLKEYNKMKRKPTEVFFNERISYQLWKFIS